ncbi:MAG TPA: glycosyltransferase family A protein [Aquaticitalea sp.]|nr:glycosyltransferase family A protein [Aquaticitalea sp.]
MPFFSIVIPLYNKEKHIKATLVSVMAQDFPDFEVIVVNDGSTDGSLAEAASVMDERIKLFSIENHGVSYARNYGIGKSSASLVAFLDADDAWKPNHLGDLKQLFEAFPDCGLYATAYENVLGNKVFASRYKGIPSNKQWSGIVDDFFESSSINCIAWTSAVMIPKTVFETIGFFDETITFGAGEDIDLWMRIALKFPIAFCNRASAIYNLEADNRISNTNTNLRTFINLNAYDEAAKTNKSLKTYLDLNRFSIAIQYKLAGNKLKPKEYIDKIDKGNLNSKQRFLLKMPTPILKIFLRIKKRLLKNGIALSAFR